MKLNKYAKQVKEFNTAFGVETNALYSKLIREEFNEWFTEQEDNSGSENELKELCDLLYVCYGYGHFEGWDLTRNAREVDYIISKCPKEHLNSIITAAYADFICTKDYLWLYRLVQGCFAYAKAKRLPIEQAFKRVHDSNMSKLENGKPILREDGKVLKGKGYKPALLTDLIKKVS